MNWGEVIVGHPSWSPAARRMWAVWPSPLDHDACFEAAGFDDFGDTDEEWFAELDTFAEGILSTLERYGPPTLVEGEYPVEGGRVRQSVRAALVAAATDDNSPVHDHVRPERVSLRTSNGHPLFWISLADGDINEILATAGDNDVRERVLDWAKLL